MNLKLNFSQVPGGAWNMRFITGTTSSTPSIPIPYKLEHVSSKICREATSMIPPSAHYALNLMNAEIAAIDQRRRDLQAQVFKELEPKLAKLMEDYPDLYPEYFI